MPKYNKLTHKVPVQIPNRSGFDLSHENLFSANPGTLTPALVDELYPDDIVSLGIKAQISLPPAATDFYGRIVAKWETFFVPYRLLYGGWQDLITHPVDSSIWPSGTTTGQKAKFLPKLNLPYGSYGPGSLTDYLGGKFFPSNNESLLINNPLPFVAYHKIYDDWYRDSRIQSPVFSRVSDSDTTGVEQTSSYIQNIPYRTFYGDSPFVYQGGLLELADGVPVYQLRQRNYAKDYFTNATPKPQAGEASRLSFKVDLETGDGSFSIASLRAANSIQQWMERQNLAGYRYGDQVKANFGVYPADAITDRCIYLGSTTMSVYNKSVYTTTTSAEPVYGSGNPFNTPGTKFSSPIGVGDANLITQYSDGKFHSTEHGFLFTIFSLVPYAYYDTGTRRYLTRSSMGDFPFPLLSGVGDQEIFRYELDPAVQSFNNQEIFGYTQRFSELKIMNDEVHGQLREGQSLSSFSLKRDFDDTVSLTSDFLRIETNAIDDVFAVENQASQFGCWVDAYFVYKKSSRFPAYSLPTLGEMKDTHTQIIDNGGKRL